MGGDPRIPTDPRFALDDFCRLQVGEPHESLPPAEGAQTWYVNGLPDLRYQKSFNPTTIWRGAVNFLCGTSCPVAATWEWRLTESLSASYGCRFDRKDEESQVL